MKNGLGYRLYSMEHKLYVGFYLICLYYYHLKQEIIDYNLHTYEMRQDYYETANVSGTQQWRYLLKHR